MAALVCAAASLCSCGPDVLCSECHPANACQADLSYRPEPFRTAEQELEIAAEGYQCTVAPDESDLLFPCEDGSSIETERDSEGRIVRIEYLGSAVRYVATFSYEMTGLVVSKDLEDPRRSSFQTSVFNEAEQETSREQTIDLIDADPVTVSLSFSYVGPATSQPSEVLAITQTSSGPEIVAHITIRQLDDGTFVEEWDDNDDGSLDRETFIGGCCPERCGPA